MADYYFGYDYADPQSFTDPPNRRQNKIQTVNTSSNVTEDDSYDEDFGNMTTVGVDSYIEAKFDNQSISNSSDEGSVVYDEDDFAPVTNVSATSEGDVTVYENGTESTTTTIESIVAGRIESTPGVGVYNEDDFTPVTNVSVTYDEDAVVYENENETSIASTTEGYFVSETTSIIESTSAGRVEIVQSNIDVYNITAQTSFPFSDTSTPAGLYLSEKISQKSVEASTITAVAIIEGFLLLAMLGLAIYLCLKTALLRRTLASALAAFPMLGMQNNGDDIIPEGACAQEAASTKDPSPPVDGACALADANTNDPSPPPVDNLPSDAASPPTDDPRLLDTAEKERLRKKELLSKQMDFYMGVMHANTIDALNKTAETEETAAVNSYLATNADLGARKKTQKAKQHLNSQDNLAINDIGRLNKSTIINKRSPMFTPRMETADQIAKKRADRRSKDVETKRQNLWLGPPESVMKKAERYNSENDARATHLSYKGARPAAAVQSSSDAKKAEYCNVPHIVITTPLLTSKNDPSNSVEKKEDGPNVVEKGVNHPLLQTPPSPPPRNKKNKPE
jgi:hypothetical protein